MTQAMADAFATGIADHPEDWHMLQRLWLKDLDPGKDPDKNRKDPENTGKVSDNSEKDPEKGTL